MLTRPIRGRRDLSRFAKMGRGDSMWGLMCEGWAILEMHIQVCTQKHSQGIHSTDIFRSALGSMVNRFIPICSEGSQRTATLHWLSRPHSASSLFKLIREQDRSFCCRLIPVGYRTFPVSCVGSRPPRGRPDHSWTKVEIHFLFFLCS